MTEIAQLVNLGSAGAVIAVVIIFLRAIEKRDTQWQTFLHAERIVANTQRKEDRDRIERIETALGRLADETARFRADFSQHATEEMTRYETIIDITRKNDQAARKSRGGV